MPPVGFGFEPAIPAGERPQTHELDRVATGISCNKHNKRPNNVLVLIFTICKCRKYL
jgi:hypothetical protein